MTHMNETAKRAVDILGMGITIAETIEVLSNLIASIAHQSPYGHYGSTRIFDDIADACIHLEMFAYIATNDEEQKEVKNRIHQLLERLEHRIDVITNEE